MTSSQWRRPRPKPAPKPRKPSRDGTYVMDNATANMMAANPGMAEAEARERALAKLLAALKAAYGGPPEGSVMRQVYNYQSVPPNE